MRTTFSIDDDTFRLVKRYAAGRSLRLGKAVSELIRKALTTTTPTRVVNGLHVFDVPAGLSTMTTKTVRELEQEE
jgi:hypothetical protein